METTGTYKDKILSINKHRVITLTKGSITGLDGGTDGNNIEDLKDWRHALRNITTSVGYDIDLAASYENVTNAVRDPEKKGFYVNSAGKKVHYSVDEDQAQNMSGLLGKRYRKATEKINNLDENLLNSTTNTTDSKVSSQWGDVWSFIRNFKNLDTTVSPEVYLLLDKAPEFETDNEYVLVGDKLDERIKNTASFMESRGKKLKKIQEEALSGLIPSASGLLISGLGKLLEASPGFISSMYNATQTLNSSGANSKSWNPWYENLEAWAGGRDTIRFWYKFNFNLGQYGLWNALEEVFKPILNLISLAIPRSIGKYGIVGPSPHINAVMTKGGWSLLVPESIEDWEGQEEDGSDWEADNRNSVYKYAGIPFFNLKFGDFFSLEKVLIKDCSCTFSSEVDNNGYPISGSASLLFETAFPISATAEDEGCFSARFGLSK